MYSASPLMIRAHIFSPIHRILCDRFVTSTRLNWTCRRREERKREGSKLYHTIIIIILKYAGWCSTEGKLQQLFCCVDERGKFEKFGCAWKNGNGFLLCFWQTEVATIESDWAQLDKQEGHLIWTVCASCVDSNFGENVLASFLLLVVASCPQFSLRLSHFNW